MFIPWWLFGSLIQFNLWHPDFGQILWGLKTLMIGLWVLSGIILAVLNRILVFTFTEGVFKATKLGLRDVAMANVWRWFSISPLFIGYVVLSLLIGEHHPFTTVPMYNYLPKQAYVFLLKSDSLDLIPLKELVTVTGAGVSHKFYSHSSTVNHFNDNFCSNMDTALARLVFNEVVPDSLQMTNLMLCRSCIDETRHFGDEIQLLYKLK